MMDRPGLKYRCRNSDGNLNAIPSDRHIPLQDHISHAGPPSPSSRAEVRLPYRA